MGLSHEAIDFKEESVITTTITAWEEVNDLEDQERTKGMLWKHCTDGNEDSLLPSSLTRLMVFRPSHGGEVSADGNCLFIVSQKSNNCA